ncbi:peptide synthetase [Sphingomonas oleivorans]|uniref:Peptide synthetase n=1 Tax=Sphingomonas oleivorans TaxID=1735121 RepID=A0A2T5FZZ5_9SPHN|nr:Pls/PosA family non-ribosomal peptide synthetase [Sphingomonas oleivorans]PTQ12276.1 peptide synthetase [Sphingomonas oleivorans]
MLRNNDYDNAPRWNIGEKLYDLFARRVRELEAEGHGDHAAIDADGFVLTYCELEAAAARLASSLAEGGTGAGSRIGLLFDKTPETYVALLAVLKTGATFIPLDASFPQDRIRYIAEDAGISLILTMRCFSDRFEGLALPIRFLDADVSAGAKPDPLKTHHPRPDETTDGTAYIIYTSGTTGRPKGVSVAHSSICNFVRVAAEVYGYRPDDRVYQGLTIAFDFSFEEIFVPLMAGATLVPGRPGTNLVGRDLQEYLVEHRVTALCCVPTLLATIEDDLPALRLLLLSGEACPQDLVHRWHRPDRIILNAYGPTETTVTASLARLTPGHKVTIGVPLPAYSILILDEKDAVEKPDGEVGEIAIAGICVAQGYLNRPELTAEKFIADTLGIPDNPSNRIYRSGDLGRITPEGEIEYLGRIDTQVKIRGYRIELGEIESALMECPQIAQAVVNGWSPEPGVTELVAYFTRREDAGPVDPSLLVSRLAERLPRYMMPSYFEELDAIPLLPSQKADRKALPVPSGKRVAGTDRPFVPPATEMEQLLADRLEKTLKSGPVSADAHFFDELGGHSLLMARFCALLRQDHPDRAPSMRDVYLHPTVRELAAALDHQQASEQPTVRQPRVHIPKVANYWICGSLQLLYYLTAASVSFILAIEALLWLVQADNAQTYYIRAMILSVGSFLLFIFVPIGLKWLLIGRFRSEEIEIWSLRYFRFWIVKNLIQRNPAVAFRGTPIFNLYLAALGAKVSFRANIDTQFVPVATDLISIGADSVVNYDVLCMGYKAEGNVIRTGPVTIGRDVHVGVASVLDIDTAIEDGAQLAPASSLREGQRLAAGRLYHGTPAIETQTSYAFAESMPCSNLRRVLFSLGQLAWLFLVMIPLAAFVLRLIILEVEILAIYFKFNWAAIEANPLGYFTPLIIGSVVVFLTALIGGLIFVILLPRLYVLFLRTGRTYTLYGLAYLFVRAAQSSSNSAFYNLLFGDSSFIVYYLRAIGYRLNRIEQTGSNFGVVHRQDAPTLCDIGSGTMVADGLYMINLEMSGSAFRLNKTVIGERNFFGNNIVYQPMARTGSNCFFATKVLIPVTGERRENIGLLGSPSFEIPRAVSRDTAIAEALSADDKKRGLARKTRSNSATIVWLLFTQWIYFTLSLCVLYFFYHLHSLSGALAGISVIMGFMLFTFAYFLLIERASLGFGRLHPALCSIYDPIFWRIERYWKLSTSPLIDAFKGTPFRNLISRARGAKVGRMVFDDGCTMTEMTLMKVGDYCTLNQGTTIQGHSLEEGVFKADHVVIGNGCTVAPGAFVHYGVRMADRSVVDSGAFLMKGETPGEASLWYGNPARPL